MVTNAGERRAFRGQLCPHLKGTGPRRPIFWGTDIRPQTATEFCKVVKLREGNLFQGPLRMLTPFELDER